MYIKLYIFFDFYINFLIYNFLDIFINIILLSWMIYHSQKFNYKSNSILSFLSYLFPFNFFQLYILSQMKSYVHFKFIMVFHSLQVCQYHFDNIYFLFDSFNYFNSWFFNKIRQIIFIFYPIYFYILKEHIIILSSLILNLYVWYFELMKNKNIYIISFLDIS